MSTHILLPTIAQIFINFIILFIHLQYYLFILPHAKIPLSISRQGDRLSQINNLTVMSSQLCTRRLVELWYKYLFASSLVNVN